MTNEELKEILEQQYESYVSEIEESYGMISLRVAADKNLELAALLFNDPVLKFRFLTDVTAIHFPDRKGEELSVITHLHNLEDNIRLRLRTFLPIEQPDTYSLVPLFAGANWMERETYDFFGVNFIGHPDLRRILNADEMDYFPLRKEYQMEDPTRLDKDDAMFGRG